MNKMASKTIALGILIQICMGMFAQQKLNVFAEGGVSKIDNNCVGERFYNVIYQPSFNLGASYQYYLFPKVYAKAGLAYMQINGKIINDLVIYTDFELEEKIAKGERFEYVSYATVPIGIGVDLNSFSFNTGLIISYAFRSKEKYVLTVWETEGKETYTNRNNLGYNKWNFSHYLQCSYAMTNKLNINAKAVFGIKDIIDGLGNAKINQFTLGVSYNIFNRNRRE